MKRRLRTLRHRVRVLARPGTVRRYLARHPRAMMELGGGRSQEGWLTADAFDPTADIYLDAERPLPFADATWDVVYSEHMLEHIAVDRVPSLLAELYRVLKPEGYLRLTVPDLEIHARRYVAGDDAWFRPILEDHAERRERRREKHWLVRTNAGALMTRASQRFYGHQWMYDFATLESCLREVGFSRISRASFGQGSDPRVAVRDRPERAFETLYLEAIR